MKKKKAKNNKKESSGKKEEKSSSSLVPPLVVLTLAILLIGGGIYFYIMDHQDGEADDNYPSDDPEDEQDDEVEAPPHLTARFETLSGSAKTLQDYRGKVVIIDMFATWCGPCETQIEELKKVSSYYAPSDVVVISVDVDYTRETSQQVSAFRDDHGADWAFLMSTAEFNEEFPATAIPTLYIVDREGNIVYDNQGVESGEALIDELRKYV